MNNNVQKVANPQRVYVSGNQRMVVQASSPVANFGRSLSTQFSHLGQLCASNSPGFYKNDRAAISREHVRTQHAFENNVLQHSVVGSRGGAEAVSYWRASSVSLKRMPSASSLRSPSASAINGSDYPASAPETPPTLSRMQSFTFSPIAQQDKTFNAIPFDQQVKPRLIRSNSSPDAINEHQTAAARCNESATFVHQDKLKTQRRAPCVFGWTEIESPKACYVTSSAKPVYKCTYCNDALYGQKNYVSTWPSVLFCSSCQKLPQCNCCHKKAVPFIYEDSEACGGKATKVQQPLLNHDGINICGQCTLLNPVVNQAHMDSLSQSGLEFLREYFGIDFTESLLKPQVAGEAADCLESLKKMGDSNKSMSLPVSRVSTPRVIKRVSTDARGRVKMLPIEMVATPHFLLSPTADHNVYGRCETRTLTFPAGLPLKYPEDAQSRVDKDGARVYRVVQKISVSKGVVESLFYGHLVHEMVHAFIWLCLDGRYGKIDLCVEEGLCNCVMAACLEQRIEILRSRRTQLLKIMADRNLDVDTKPTVKEIEGIHKTRKFWQLLKRHANDGKASPDAASDIAEDVAKALSDGLVKFYLYSTEYELKITNRRLGEMERDSNKAYGLGYRTMRELLHHIPALELIYVMEKNGSALDNTVAATIQIIGVDKNEFLASIAKAAYSLNSNPVVESTVHNSNQQNTPCLYNNGERYMKVQV